MAFSFPSSRIAFLSVIANMFIFSTITTILQSLILVFPSSLAASGFNIPNIASQSHPDLTYQLLTLNNASTKLMLASSIIALTESLICAIFTIRFWPNAKRTYLVPPIPTFFYALLFNAFLSLIALIYLLVIHSKSSDFGPQYQGPYWVYDQGIFDFESWACQLSQHESEFPASYCRTAKAGRIVSIVYCISGVAAAIVGVWALRRERETIERARKLKKTHDEYWIETWDGGEEIEPQQGLQLPAIVK